MGGSSTGVQDDPHIGSYAHTMGFDQADIAASQHIASMLRKRADDKLATEQKELNAFRLASATTTSSSSTITPAIRVPPKEAALAVLPSLKRKARADASATKKASASASAVPSGTGTSHGPEAAKKKDKAASEPPTKTTAPADSAAKPAASMLGLVSYSSDSDEGEDP